MTIALGTSRDLKLKGAIHKEARVFSEELQQAWTRFNLGALEKEAAHLQSISARLEDLASPSRYPAACRLAHLLNDACDLDARLLSKLPSELLEGGAIDPETAARIKAVRAFADNPEKLRADGTKAFVTAELERWEGFFDRIDSHPLTPEQRLSIVTDEDATLVLAGAGSGKTSVITAKAAYLVKAGSRKPGEILLLAFARNAAEEMTARVEARSGAPIAARTFHALAYEIIAAVEGSKPALAEHAADDLVFANFLREILKDLVRTRPEAAKTIIQWFAHFLAKPKSEWDFKTKHDYYSYIERQDMRTLQGEQVKSYEELQIANWLYENGIEYEYEPVYEHKVSGAGRRDYQPDFRLTESGIYIEHFGVRRQRLPDGSEQLITAPFIDRAEYLASMEWKREVHARHGTVLIETFSYEREEGRLLEDLAKKLAQYVTPSPRPAEQIYDRIIGLKQVDDFSKLLGTFLRKYKSGGYTLEECKALSERMKLGRRAQAFLELFAPVLGEYEKRLGGRIDFEDMIQRAVRYVETGQYVSPYRHILVDEFQDISQSRARLLKALKNQHPDTRLFAVGDDWQAIFRFAGSDLYFMRHFGREFGGSFAGAGSVHRVIDLGRTFRCVDQIAFAARTFILRNPSQIIKEIVPKETAPRPAIRIVLVSNGENVKKLNEALASIADDQKEKQQRTSVLLLGRYHFLKPDMSDLARRFPQLSISFRTIHASKGLEADHVILLGADSGSAGFPSEMADDPLLALVSPEEEAFSNAEERRVMYVAMTRARHSLTIMASHTHPSAFVTELQEDRAYGLAAARDTEPEVEGCGECGGRLLRLSGQDGRIRYRCEHDQHCGNRLPACSSCGMALPHRRDGTAALCVCGATYPPCPDCTQGWLIERNGPYGRFLGCVRYPLCSGRASISSMASGARLF